MTFETEMRRDFPDSGNRASGIDFSFEKIQHSRCCFLVGPIIYYPHG